MPETKGSYYLAWFKRSTRSPLGLMQVSALLLAVVGAFVGYVNPELAESARLLLWLIPTSALVLLISIAGSRASYDLYRELKRQSDQARQELGKARNELVEQQASRMRSVAGFIFQCREIHSSDDARFVLSRLSHFLRHRCGELEAFEFETILAPITEDSFDDTENAAEIRNDVIEEAVEYLKRVRQCGGSSGPTAHAATWQH